ncbi:porin family protein [Flavobacterium terrisoli]|uniref:porin family protein n=1 Tax=Flavobacterium terrisoli TaxID=3242195 RepID=UPI002542BB04|nr:porin family protein [Flavobacterium buctense]
MKNTVLAIIVLLGFSASISAQKKGDVEFGINVGYNSSSASDRYGSFDSGSGYNVGGSLDYYFLKDWSIKGKLIYDQKGWDNDIIENSNDGNIYYTDYNLNYLTVPIMASWHFGNKRNWYLSFGPYFGFLLDAKDTTFDADMSEYFNDNDFGFAVNVGVKIPVSDKLKLFFEYDGQGGISDINAVSGYPSLTNSRSSFNVGLNFLLK